MSRSRSLVLFVVTVSLALASQACALGDILNT